jgi:hypothetical protein
MIKRVLKYLLIVIIVFISFYFIHEYVLSSKQLNLSYSLLNVYLFNAIASILVFSAIEIIANKLPDQAGYAFLACIFLKIGFFLVLFQGIIFPELKLELFQRLSLIIPFFLYIILESVSISKLLNSKT